MAILRRRSGKIRKLVLVRIAVAVMPAGIEKLNRAGGVGLLPCSFASSGRGERSPARPGPFFFCQPGAVRCFLEASSWRTDFQCYKFVTVAFRHFGAGAAVFGENVQIFYDRYKNARSNSAEKVQNPIRTR